MEGGGADSWREGLGGLGGVVQLEAHTPSRAEGPKNRALSETEEIHNIQYALYHKPQAPTNITPHQAQEWSTELLTMYSVQCKPQYCHIVHLIDPKSGTLHYPATMYQTNHHLQAEGRYINHPMSYTLYHNRSLSQAQAQYREQ